MHDKRAMFAGLGTATMLAGAVACVFILGSAVVAFKGWPGGSVDTPPVTNRALVVRDGVQSSRMQLAGAQAAQERRAAETARTRVLGAQTRVASAASRAARDARATAPGTDGASSPTTQSSPTGGIAVPGANATPPQAVPPDTTTPKAAPTLPSAIADSGRRPADITRSADRQLDAVGDRLGTGLAPLNPVLGATVRRVVDQLGNALAATGRGLEATTRRLGQR